MASPPPSFSSPSSQFHLHLSSPNNSFPVLAIALIGILATAFLLIAYYVFVIKCCLHWHRIDVLNRFSSRRRRNSDSPTSLSDNLDIPKGLDDVIIRSIPVIKFRKLTDKQPRSGENNDFNSSSTPDSYECAVCLSEFEEGDKLRVIPNCCHAFHIDCIDIWLQSNANCPLCRSYISPSSIVCGTNTNTNTSRICSGSDSFTGNDEDYVVIEIEGNNLDEPRLVVSNQEDLCKEKKRRFKHVRSVGNDYEWIHMMRNKINNDIYDDHEFRVVQPVRRSVSLDLSSVDREFCMEIQQQCCRGEIITSCGTEECGSSSSSGDSNSSSNSNSNNKVRRSIFSFGYGRNSRGCVQPLHLDP